MLVNFENRDSWPSCRHSLHSFALRSSLIAAVVVAMISSQQPATAQDLKSPELKYGWKPGQYYTYSVVIEADQGDYWDVYSGYPTYTVLSVDDEGIKLSFRGTLKESRKAKPGRRVRIFGGRRRTPFSPIDGVGRRGKNRDTELTIDQHGNLVSIRGSSQLPFLLGNLSQLLFDPLPKAGATSATVTRDISIHLSDGRSRFSPRGRANTTKKLAAVETTTYTVTKVMPDFVSIRKKYELKTADKVAGESRFEIQGVGTTTFDYKVGTPLKLEYELTEFVRTENVVRETPVKVTFTLLDKAARTKLAQTIEGASLFPYEPLNDEQVQEVLADLKSDNATHYLGAMKLLQGKRNVKPNAEISKALEAWLADETEANRWQAAKCLEQWATIQAIPTLMKTLDDKSMITRHAAMMALAWLQVEKTAEPIATHLANQKDRLGASKALKKMGVIAESAVLKHLENDDWMVRLEAVRILQVIGTDESIPSLQARQSDSQALIQRVAGEAIQAIQERQ